MTTENGATVADAITDTDQPAVWQQDMWLFAILGFILAFAPLFRGGNRPLALLVINLAGIGLATVLLWNPGRLLVIPIALRMLFFLILVSIAVYLIPLPKSWWLAISGREMYAEALRLVLGDADFWHSMSILPVHTEAMWFKMLTYISVFMATYCLPAPQVQRLVYMVVVIACLEAVVGLIQYGEGPSSILRFGATQHARDAIGTYANRDHLAGFLEMVNPIVLGLLVAELGHEQSNQNTAGSKRRRRKEFFASLSGQRAVLMGLVAVLLLLSIVFTRSRGGIAMAMLGMFLAMLMFAWRLGGDNVYGSVGSIIALLVVLAAEIGLLPVLDRFSQDPMQDARWTLYATTIDGIGRFFPFGSGAGTFPFVYPAFQPVKLGGYFINHTHNDFLEAIFDLGLLAVILIFWALLLYFARWRAVRARQDRWGGFRFIQIGAGIGVLMLLLHSLLDFNLQIPANAAFFAFFAAIFFKDYKEVGVHGKKRRHRHHSRDNTDQRTDGTADAADDNAVKAEDPVSKPAALNKWEDFGTKNPFLDESFVDKEQTT